MKNKKAPHFCEASCGPDGIDYIGPCYPKVKIK
jgi:hypothetical protein